MKKYLDIERCKQSYAETFHEGERIVIQEKIDGANASFYFNSDTNTLECCSRKRELSFENTLNGFYIWVKSLNTEAIKEIIGDRYIIFGEWMGAKHSISYPNTVMNKFWMFDVWNKETEQYLPYKETIEIFHQLNEVIETNFNFVPVFYNGVFSCWNEISAYIGKTLVNAEPSGEGIVIKRQDYLDSKSSRLPFYVKIVAEQFSEVHGSKKQRTIDPELVARKQALIELAETIVTMRRVEKTIYKFIDEKILRPDWDEHDMKFLAANLPKVIYEDCKKEEPETVVQIENFGKICASITMKHVRQLLTNQ